MKGEIYNFMDVDWGFFRSIYRLFSELFFSNTYRTKVEADLIPGNDQMYNVYFWNGTTMWHLKIGILNLANDASWFFRNFYSNMVLSIFHKIKG